MDILGIPKDNKLLLSVVCATALWVLFAFTRPKKKKDTKKYSVVIDEKERIRRAPESPHKVGISTSLTATGLSHPPVLVRESARTLKLSVRLDCTGSSTRQFAHEKFIHQCCALTFYTSLSYIYFSILLVLPSF